MHTIMGRTSKLCSEASRRGFEPRTSELSGDGSSTERQVSCLSSKPFFNSQKIAFVIENPMPCPCHEKGKFTTREPFMGIDQRHSSHGFVDRQT